MNEIMAMAKEIGISNSAGLNDFDEQRTKANNLIGDLDVKLNRVLKKQEYEYL